MAAIGEDLKQYMACEWARKEEQADDRSIPRMCATDPMHYAKGLVPDWDAISVYVPRGVLLCSGCPVVSVWDVISVLSQVACYSRWLHAREMCSTV